MCPAQFFLELLSTCPSPSSSLLTCSPSMWATPSCSSSQQEPPPCLGVSREDRVLHLSLIPGKSSPRSQLVASGKEEVIPPSSFSAVQLEPSKHRKACFPQRGRELRLRKQGHHQTLLGKHGSTFSPSKSRPTAVTIYQQHKVFNNILYRFKQNGEKPEINSA